MINWDKKKSIIKFIRSIKINFLKFPLLSSNEKEVWKIVRTRERKTDGHVAEKSIGWISDEWQRQCRCDRHNCSRWQRYSPIVSDPEESLLSMMSSSRARLLRVVRPR